MKARISTRIFATKRVGTAGGALCPDSKVYWFSYAQHRGVKPLLQSEAQPHHRHSGFALVLTLTLLALLVLALYALSALVRVNGQISVTGLYQTQARQNALLGLNVALSELQRHAGDDTRITGMAGLTGIAAGAGNNTRHWCGVWDANGVFVTWLTSGAQTAGLAALQASVTPIELVASGAVGAAAANSEHVIAGKIPIIVTETPGAPGVAATVGHYAYLVSDEGVKISAYAPSTQLVIPGVRPLLTSTVATSAPGKLRAAVGTYAGKLPGVLTYEQLAVLPTPASALTPSVLQDNFHHVTLTARSVAGSQTFAGTMNLNTTSAIVWRSILETYNSASGVTPMSAANLTARGNAIANALAASASGKLANGPFTSVAAYGSSTLLAANLPAPITPGDFMAAIGPLLTVRSDTFRIRAYGEALNPVDPAQTEAITICEAIVQRTSDPAANGLGRKFIVTYFRWLGPEEL